MHHDGTSRNQATHGYSPFFQVFDLKKTRSWTHPVTGSPRGPNEEYVLKTCPPRNTVKEEYLLPYYVYFYNSWRKLTVFFPLRANILHS